MANRHFGKLADTWKHLSLAEILSLEQPRQYWESHAGSATYVLVDDPERRYGALSFVVIARRHEALARSRYTAHLATLKTALAGPASYPGSPLLAMLERGLDCSYLLCDIDPASAANLKESATELGLGARTTVLVADGMATLHEALSSAEHPHTTLAHIDPYDPRLPGASGLSALDLARELIGQGAGLMYWYGYDRPGHRAWALDELSTGATDRPLWCGDIMVTSGTNPRTRSDGDLGLATTPGTGFGIVCGNISDRSVTACQRLGEELSLAYDAIPLPDGTAGHLDFASLRSSGYPTHSTTS